jgi:rhodanese-related sulfurtransferase
MASEIAPKDAAALVDDGATLIDVRDADEYEAGHIAGARHIPIDRLSEAAAGDGAVILYCRSGDRSEPAAAAFAASGRDAHSIAGGLLAWSEAGLPLEPEDGTVVERAGLPPR